MLRCSKALHSSQGDFIFKLALIHIVKAQEILIWHGVELFDTSRMMHAPLPSDDAPKLSVEQPPSAARQRSGRLARLSRIGQQHAELRVVGLSSAFVARLIASWRCMRAKMSG